MVGSFGAYFCMYAFRKPFVAGSYESADAFFGLDYKTTFIIAQVLGYTLSKFWGIRFVSGLEQKRRNITLLVLIGIALLGLLGFGFMPIEFKPLAIFVNGLPLGLIWGIVFSYLEGHHYTEFVGAFLSVSIIVASGILKSVGMHFLNQGVEEFWMPFCVGLLFILPFIFFVHLLEKVDPPSADEIQDKSLRIKMNKQDRASVLNAFLTPILAMICFYVLLTVVRDLRDNYMIEVAQELNLTSAAIFTTTEIPIAIITMIVMFSIGSIKKNRLALNNYLSLFLISMVLLLVCNFLFKFGILSSYWWIVGTGLFLFSSYLPLNGIFFERIIATFKISGNIGFFVMIADAFGYLGSVSLMLTKGLMFSNILWVPFFQKIFTLLAIGGILFTATTWITLSRKQNKILSDEKHL